MKIITIVGARPQFIKAAAVSRKLQSHPSIQEVLVHTGQHYDENMSDVFFQELEIPKPNYHLGIGSSNHGAQTGRMLEAIEQVLQQESPDWVLVYGDTNSTLAGAIASVKLHIPVAHVEAGLRSFNRRMPEEINRVLTDHAADLLFAPTTAAVENLQHEGIAQEKIHLVGDVMYDAALDYAVKAEEKSLILQKLGLTAQNYILATIHRAENTDDSSRLQALFTGLAKVSQNIPVILPLHPRTRAALLREGLSENISKSLRIIEPVGYLDMVMLEKNAKLITTDSGGVQKEAFFYRVPCVTLRAETEWVELVQLGWNRLLPPLDATDVASGILEALESNSGNEVPETLYGGGLATSQIVELLSQNIGIGV
ncbi:non-hydrolyzing UDP-N-acetylglucosamine 2-epimerase [Nostoc sp. FACHB-190]|uniref:non-hydrolyzing UDP-N-acetylglucosamine 2-epimerase n=1 Tax=Nostoc sp. FACHB-190 TaxID=2692838 RepID=UPI001688BE93|nr:UDP-N-acetylglucosamine 2-epimerase (non-hydrolyzing) [Nostoc sp. FACHB-190]MBD2297075.1 UDP-N-acetylglucosamine 2-epimerase (non-hydrolyzing) [Nostoc sp. FACHB-190]